MRLHANHTFSGRRCTQRNADSPLRLCAFASLRYIVFLMALLLLAACGDDPTPTPLPTQAVAVPTFTPTPLAPVNSAPTAQPRELSPEGRAPVQPADTPTAAATPDPNERLAQAAHLHRYGYYSDEQWMLLGLLADAGADESQRLTARYRLAESFLAEDNFTQALDSLDKFQLESVALAEDDPRRVKAIFLRGDALAGLNRMSEAVAAYQTFLESHPDLAGVVQEIIGDGWQRNGDNERAAAAFRLAADATADRVETVRILEKLAEVLEGQGRWAEAAAVLEEMLSRSVNPGYRVGLLLRAGNARALGGDDSAAIQHWQSALLERPESAAACHSLVQLARRGRVGVALVTCPEDTGRAEWQQILDAYQAYLEQPGLESSRVGEAWVAIGQAYTGLGRRDDAHAAYDRVIADFANCACFGKAWLGKARAEILSGDPAAGRRIYRTFAREHPSDPDASEALWRSALSAIAADNQLEAATDLLALADAFPGSERAADGLSVLGIGAYANGLYGQAEEAFGRLRGSYPETRPEASAYWLGRALYAQGQQTEARRLWEEVAISTPGDYYGVLAALGSRRTGYPPQEFIFGGMEQAVGPATTLSGDDGSRAFAEGWLSGWVTGTVESWGVLPVAVARDADLRNGQLLLDLGRRGEALAQLDLVYRRYRDDPTALYALALHFEELETFRLSLISALWLVEHSPAKTVENGPIFLQRMAYPRHFAELIDAEAARNGIDPLIFYSLIRQESLFEEGARSFAAAQGLAQIIPATGQEIAGRVGFPNYSNALIYRPHINIRFGAFYLAWVRDFVDGRIASALAGYNGGPGNSQRWRERAGPDDTLFVELMDFSETRLYLQRILSHYYHYTRLYR